MTHRKRTTKKLKASKAVAPKLLSLQKKVASLNGRMVYLRHQLTTREMQTNDAVRLAQIKAAEVEAWIEAHKGLERVLAKSEQKAAYWEEIARKYVVSP